MDQFRGLSAFPVTPSETDGRVDTDRLQRLVANLNKDGISSIGVLGSTGGYMYHNSAERVRAIEAAVEASEKPVLVGIGDIRTSDVIAHASAAEAAGADGLLLAPVSYLPLRENDVEGLFADVAGACGLPILIYNNPSTTHFTITETLLARLATIEGVVAVKNPPPADRKFESQIDRLRGVVPPEFSLGYSGDSAIAGALAAGTDAWYSVLGGTLPEVALKMWAARTTPDELADLEAALAAFFKLFDQYGSIRVIYEVTEHVGLGPTALPKPLLPLGVEVRREIDAALAHVL